MVKFFYILFYCATKLKDPLFVLPLFRTAYVQTEIMLYVSVQVLCISAKSWTEPPDTFSPAKLLIQEKERKMHHKRGNTTQKIFNSRVDPNIQLQHTMIVLLDT